ncbi:MAG: hypothetical protein M0R44_10160 [Candidatus Marinimicrobia bacterium]|jgi:hypothetical protein|nr:hypothetical protein [Candidatus Neomarinimicrobiota bacterium]
MGAKRRRGELAQSIEQTVERLRTAFGGEWFELGDAHQLIALNSSIRTGEVLDRAVRAKMLEYRFNTENRTDEYRVKPAVTEEDG